MSRIVLVQTVASVAFRNLISHRRTGLLVGGLMVAATMLVVVGTALVDSVDRAMARSVTGSVAGHIQVYSADHRDPLALFGTGVLASDDVGEIPRFEVVAKTLRAVPNVSDVVPMGMRMSQVIRGNEVDRLVESMRAGEQSEDGIRRLQVIASELEKEYGNRLSTSDDPDRVGEQLADLARVQSAEFWREGTLDEQLLWVSRQIAPLQEEGEIVFLRLLGTDPAAFAAAFDRFTLVRGNSIPQGMPGLILSEPIHDQEFKHPVARIFDDLDQKSAEDRSLLSRQDDLQDSVARLSQLHQRLTLDVDPRSQDAIRSALAELAPERASLNELLQTLLAVTPENFDKHRSAFYDVVAPAIELYSVDVGDTLTLRAFTRSGYLQSVNAKIYGISRFSGLEGSELAGSHTLVDLVTFRKLYGEMGEDALAELDGLREELALAELSASDREQSMFTGGTLEVEATASNDFPAIDRIDAATQETDGYDPAVLQRGLVLNAAVILEDPRKTEETLERIRARVDEEQLGLTAVGWKSASGMMGQFVTVVRVVMFSAFLVILLVGSAVMNNSMVMATLERVGEFGTMRAIGASARLVCATVVLETLLLGLAAGTVGAVLGAAAVWSLGESGISAGQSEVLNFLFSGPTLYPTLSVGTLATGIAVMLVVSLVSGLYPARLAMRVHPVVAMGGADG
ncbi:MAG: FtsX-like permease family protein [Myxococcota bacterium]